MNDILKEYLFDKSILVSNTGSKHPLETLFTIANRFSIRITEGIDKAHEDLIPFIAEQLGTYIPQPFYRNFPDSVRTLTSDMLAFDQLVHYTVTYGFGCFSAPGHSVFEKDFERLAFDEDETVRDFVIVDEDEAKKRILTFADDLLKSTRPLNRYQLTMLSTLIEEEGYVVTECACKDTAISLMLNKGDTSYSKFITLPDVIRMVEAINEEKYGEVSLRKLNLTNKERKLITKTIDRKFETGCSERHIRECFEKKAIWCGLLHHIHYKPRTPVAEKFVAMIRGKENISAYSDFERAMSQQNIKLAVDILLEEKGSGALLRKLNYILSRCKTQDEIDTVIDSIHSKNAIILIQLLIQYSNYTAIGARNFKFTKFNRMKTHIETNEECRRRRSVLYPKTVNKMCSIIRKKLHEELSGRVGKVYIDPQMYNIAVPIQETTSNGGFGVLPRGSRLPIEKGKKIRAFTYWEQVDDIDLSVFGIDSDGKQQTEYSWRTMRDSQSDCITFSGDQTSGYSGGSEYFDIDVKLFKKMNPETDYLVFCNNVYSETNFNECICKAGYMLRDIKDSGEIFEPKTVASSFNVDCESTYAYLFGIDLKTNDFVWLNTSLHSNEHVAGRTSMSVLNDYFKYTSIINLGTLFEMLSTEIVDAPEQADVVVSDTHEATKEGSYTVKSHDFERITALLNNP
ncbi:MAG: TerD family protein [Clostridia bacterium]|nr:TerD family protein [Clostridia bacterium]